MDDPFHVWTNAANDGLRLQIFWAETQTGENTYDWSKIDTSVANAKKYGKQLGLSLVVCGSPPAWLKVQKYVVTTKNGSMSFVLPWQTDVQPAIIKYLTALLQRYDGLVDYILVGGAGYNLGETFFPIPTGTIPNIPLSLADEIVVYTASTNLLLDVYAANLHKTTFVLAVGIPFNDKEGTKAITDVVTRAVTKYGRIFGVMNWGLTAHSTTAFLPDAWVSQYSSTHPTGLQFTGNSLGTVGGDIGGTVQQTLDAAIALKAQWVEIYPVDSHNTAYAAAFIAARAKLAQPPL